MDAVRRHAFVYGLYTSEPLPSVTSTSPGPLSRVAVWPPGRASSEDALLVQVPTVSAAFRDASSAVGARAGVSVSGWHPVAMDARPASNNDNRVVFMYPSPYD